jgi:hypothetical protein
MKTRGMNYGYRQLQNECHITENCELKIWIECKNSKTDFPVQAEREKRCWATEKTMDTRILKSNQAILLTHEMSPQRFELFSNNSFPIVLLYFCNNFGFLRNENALSIFACGPASLLV